MKPTSLILALLFCVTPAVADNYPRQPSIDIQHYIFRVTLSDENDEITGEATVSVRFTKDGVSSFWLDLASAANGKGMTVSDVTSQGAAVKFAHQNSRLTISLEAPSKAGELRDFTVKYRGIPADGLKFPKNKFGDRTFFSVNWPDKAHEWLPTVDHPYDKATSEFIVTAPAKYQVVANGLLQEEFDLGDGRRAHALEAVRAHRHMAEQYWRGRVRVAAFRAGGGRAAAIVEFSQGPRERHRHIGRAVAAIHRVLCGPHWAVSVREAGGG